MRAGLHALLLEHSQDAEAVTDAALRGASRDRLLGELTRRGWLGLERADDEAELKLMRELYARLTLATAAPDGTLLPIPIAEVRALRERLGAAITRRTP